MALDEALALSARRDISPPTLRIYGWTAPSVSIGRFQRIEDINIDYCFKNHIPIVRRPTGGRAVLHDREITYSFSAKTTSGIFSKGLLDSYKKISAALGLAFTKAGLSPELKLLTETKRSLSVSDRSRNPLCFKSISYGEISIDSKKIVGSAQKRWPDGLLQQGSIPIFLDKREISKVFRLGSPQELKESFIGLGEIAPGLDYEKLRDAVRISFEETFNVGFISSSPSNEEVSLALELEVEKYLAGEWNLKR